jgi:hypothetical protein
VVHFDDGDGEMCWLCFWFGIGDGRWLSEGEGKVKVEKMKDARKMSRRPG